MPDRKHVLFLSTRNGARSIMAEAIVNQLGASYFRGFSAGLAPRPAVPQPVLDVLSQRRYPVHGLRPHGWKEFQPPRGPRIDCVITIDDAIAEGETPRLPNNPLHARWHVANPFIGDPHPASLRQRLLAVFDYIELCVEMYMTMPEIYTDRQDLQRRIESIEEQIGRQKVA